MYTAAEQKENREALIAALRSGDYLQGCGALNYNNRLCCLGVACDLYFRKEKNIQVTKYGLCIWYEGRGDYLPSKVMKWLGYKDSLGSLPIFCSYTSLSEANDNGMDFDSIADLMEVHENFLCGIDSDKDS